MTVREERNHIVLTPSGRLDGLSAEQFIQEGRHALGTAQGRYLLDLTEITQISSAGLRGILLLANEARKAGGVVSIYAPLSNAMVWEILNMSGFAMAIPMHSSLDEAFGAASGE